MLKQMGWNLNRWLGLCVQSNCPLCQRSTPHTFCLDCQRQLQRCQYSSFNWTTANELSIAAWGRYSGSLKRAIAALKYHNQPHLAEPLGQWMGQAWEAGSTSRAIVVPIPMHRHKQQQRGYNQAELLARSFCAIARLPLETRGLERIRATEAQFGLSSIRRQQNLQDAFRVSDALLKRPPSQPILLLDDIYTTGATALSAAQTLRKRGIRVQGIIVLAKAELESRHNPFP